jgi:hypothetical protein
MHNISRLLTEKITALRSRDCTKGDNQRYQKPLTIYGTPGLGINNTTDALNCAACATVRQKTGAMS